MAMDRILRRPDIADTFGSFKKLKARFEDDWKDYSERDEGYLVVLESSPEAKFLTNNYLMQKFMWTMNFMDQHPTVPLPKTVRLDPDFPEDVTYPSEGFDEYGFERKDTRRPHLPLFTPLSEMLSSQSDQGNNFMPQRILQYYVLEDINTSL